MRRMQTGVLALLLVAAAGCAASSKAPPTSTRNLFDDAYLARVVDELNLARYHHDTAQMDAAAEELYLRCVAIRGGGIASSGRDRSFCQDLLNAGGQ